VHPSTLVRKACDDPSFVASERSVEVRCGLVFFAGMLAVACTPIDGHVGVETEGGTTRADSDAASTGETDSSDHGSTADPEEPPPPDPGDPWEPVPSHDPLDAERLAELQGRVDGWLGDASIAGTTQSVLVIDLETGQTLYAKNPDLVLKPASTTKLFTTAAAFDVLGDDHRLETTVWLDGDRSDGALAGDLVLRGEHDIHWSTHVYPSSRFVLDRLAEALDAAGLGSVSGNVVAAGEFLVEGYHFGTYAPAEHRNVAAADFVSALGARGISTTGTSTSASFDAPAGMPAVQWRSPPIAVGSVQLNSSSNNEFADTLVRHLGWAMVGTSSYETGTGEVVDFLGSIGSETTGVVLNDGSGLSHDNRVSARNLLDLIAFTIEQPWGRTWERTLSISGTRGTLANRLEGPDVHGRVFAKTGTLTGVITLSGILHRRHDGRRIAFAILLNEVGTAVSARAAADGVVSVLAEDWHELGPRPAAPVLRTVRSEAGSAVAELTWHDVPDAEGIIVWLSPDGRTFDRDDARFVQGGSYRAGTLPFGPEIFVRLQAWRDGVASVPSDVYGTTIEAEDPRILVVDGNDRWQAEPVVENPLAHGHDFAVHHLQAIAPRPVDVVANEAVLFGEVELADYAAIVWMLGEESTEHETFDPDEQALVADYLQTGGNFFVSGAEIGWDLVENGDAADQAFFRDVLHADYLGDDALTVAATTLGGPWSSVGPVGFWTPAEQEIHYPDRLAPHGGSEPVLTYLAGTQDTAGVRYVGEHRVVVLGFPFESIDHPDARRAFMTEVLTTLGL
jgi:D-alanyl-D-alanine carboxypeptidase